VILLLLGLAWLIAWAVAAGALIWLMVYVIVRAVRKNRYPQEVRR
jgi:hypothetical protein